MYSNANIMQPREDEKPDVFFMHFLRADASSRVQNGRQRGVSRASTVLICKFPVDGY